jgi:iron(III) transport system ATP-binding protein
MSEMPAVTAPTGQWPDRTHAEPTSGGVVGSVSAAGRPVVQVSDLHKSYYGADGTSVPAVDGISLTLEAGKFMVLLGPSGCGKTTLLRCIAGLEQPQSGRIEVGGRAVYSSADRLDVPSYKRQLSMVFQSYALWPHMSVFDNIAYPLRSSLRNRPGKAEIRSRVERLMELVGIEHLSGRYPSQISGGQQQRVALCRALVPGSEVVLFDEPLSNVDAKVRERLRLQLLTLQRELGFAALFVTHDRQEAMVLAHSIAVLEAGKVAQLGAPREVYGTPANKYVAEFMGPTNKLEGELQAGVGAVRVIHTEIGPVRGILSGAAAEAEPGTRLVAMWRPEFCRTSASSGSGGNEWSVTAQESLYSGAYMEHIFQVGELTMRSMTTDMAPLSHGDSTWLSVAPEDVTIIAG